MPFENFKQTNNAIATIANTVGGSSLDTTVIVATGFGDVFGAQYPILATMIKKEVDASDPSNFVVVRREIVRITNISGDNLTVVRGAGTTIGSDKDGNPGYAEQGNIIFAFDPGDTIYLGVTAEQFSDVNTELVRLEDDKLDLSAFYQGGDFAQSTTGTDAYQIAITDATAYVNGSQFAFQADVINTPAATFEVNALGAKTIFKRNDQTLQSGDIAAQQIVVVRYDSGKDAFQMITPEANASSGIEVSLLTKSYVLGEDFVAGAGNGAGFVGCGNTTIESNTENTTIPFGNVAAFEKVRLSLDSSIFPTNTNHLWSFGFKIAKIGSPTDKLTFKLFEDTQEIVGFNVLEIDQADIDGTLFTITAGRPFFPKVGSQIFIEISREDPVDAVNHYSISVDNTGPLAGAGFDTFDGSAWNAGVGDLVFVTTRGFESGRMFRTDSRYSETNKADGIIQSNGSTGDTRPFTIEGNASNTGGVLCDEYYVNNEITDALYVQEQNNATFTLNKNLNTSAGALVQTFTPTVTAFVESITLNFATANNANTSKVSVYVGTLGSDAFGPTGTLTDPNAEIEFVQSTQSIGGVIERTLTFPAPFLMSAGTEYKLVCHALNNISGTGVGGTQFQLRYNTTDVHPGTLESYSPTGGYVSETGDLFFKFNGSELPLGTYKNEKQTLNESFLVGQQESSSEIKLFLSEERYRISKPDMDDFLTLSYNATLGVTETITYQHDLGALPRIIEFTQGATPNTSLSTLFTGKHLVESGENTVTGIAVDLSLSSTFGFASSTNCIQIYKRNGGAIQLLVTGRVVSSTPTEFSIEWTGVITTGTNTIRVHLY